MKKFVLAIVALLALAGTAQAYTVQRGDTLSQIAQDHNTTVESIVAQNGIQNPDLILEGQELVLEEETFGASIPTVVALYEDSLASRITSAASSLTLVRGTDKQDRSLNGYYGFVVDEGSSTEEFMTANCVATACTIVARGIDVQDGSSEVSELKFEHRRGASVKISNFPQLAILSRVLNGQDTTGTNTLKIGDTSATTTKSLIFTHGTSTAFRGIGWNGTNLIWSDDGSNTYTFSSSSPSVLSASSTRAIGVTDSKIHINASSTTGITFDSSGNIYQKVDSGLTTGSSGLKVTTSTLITGNVASSTATAYYIPIGDFEGRLSDYWLAPGRLNASPYVLGEAINTYSGNPVAVYLNPTDNRVYKTLGSSTTNTFPFVGFMNAFQDVGVGANAYIQTAGRVYNFSGLTSGDSLYITNTAGVVSSTPGTYQFKVGRAIGTDSVLIERGRRIYQGSSSFSSTATTTITIGFRPSKISIVATDGDNDITNGVSKYSTGVWTPNGSNANYVAFMGGSGCGAGCTRHRVDSGLSWAVYTTYDTSYHRGIVTNVTNSGFDLANVKASTPNDITLIWVAED